MSVSFLSTGPELAEGRRLAINLWRLLLIAGVLLTSSLPSFGYVVINEIHYAPKAKTEPIEFIEIYNTATTSIDLSGWEFSGGIEFRFANGVHLEGQSFGIVVQDREAFYNRFKVASLGTWEGAISRLSNEEELLVLKDSAGETLDRVRYRSRFPWPSGSNRTGASMELLSSKFDNDLGGNWRPSRRGPTPGSKNSVWRSDGVPVLRQVKHSPREPRTDDDVVVEIKVTDASGVPSVALEFQLVEPGNYIARQDPIYETRWSSLKMNDGGIDGDRVAQDEIYAATISSAMHGHRSLVRYRVVAKSLNGNITRAPYSDDPQPNFAYFVYDNVPTWTGAAKPNSSPSVVYTEELLESVPVYHLITTRQSHVESQHIPNSRKSSYQGNEYPFHGALVYEGRVYDHIRYRARGGVWRYAMGKNMWKFDFNRGHEFSAQDNFGRPYETSWRKLNFSAMIQQGSYGQRGEHGVFEAAGFRLHNLAGNPAPHTHYVHFRIVENADERGPTGSQYDDDFQGLYLVVEQMDGRFLEEHGLPDGNLYKMEAGSGTLNNQGPFQESNRTDLYAFLQGQRRPSRSWWEQNLDLNQYYSFRAIAMAIHDFDMYMGKNYFYFNNPETKRWSVHNWDIDLTWTTEYQGAGGRGPLNRAVLSDPFFKTQYNNRVREIRDLLFNPEQTGVVLDETVQWVYTPGKPSLVDADRAMWDYNPILSSHYVQGRQAREGQYYRVVQGKGFGALMEYLKSYVGAWGGWMDQTILNDEGYIPETPVLAYTGDPGYAIDELSVTASKYSSKKSVQFRQLEWRLGEITDPASESFNRRQPRRYEKKTLWSDTITDSNQRSVALRSNQIQADHTYRVRARDVDEQGRCSHWSAPIQFQAGLSRASVSLLDGLRITEIMSDPKGPNREELKGGYSSADFEYLELTNRLETPLDLSPLVFKKGIKFKFKNLSIRQLDPKQTAVVVRNRFAFRARYGPAAIVLGEYMNGKQNNLNDSGERLQICDVFGSVILDFSYSDNKGSVATDGESLQLKGPLTSRNQTGGGESWTLGTGTPGQY